MLSQTSLVTPYNFQLSITVQVRHAAGSDRLEDEQSEEGRRLRQQDLRRPADQRNLKCDDEGHFELPVESKTQPVHGHQE